MKPLPKAFFANDIKPVMVLIFVALLVFLRALWFEFSPLDEHWLILNNEAFLKSSGSFFKTFTEPTSQIYYRPFHFASFLIDYRSGGLDPFFYHLTNILLHLFNLVLIFKLLQQYQITKQLAFCLTLLFSVHPLLLGSVVWVPGRNDEILSLFFIAALYSQNLYLRSGKSLHLVFCWLAFVGALLSKESAIFFPVVYVANAYVKTGKFKNALIKFAIPLAVITAAWFFLRMKIVPEIPMQPSQLTDHILNFFKVMLIYFGKILIPVQQSVFPTISNSSILPGIITLGILVVLFFYGNIANKRIALFGIFLFVGVLVIPIWFMSNNVAREQYENRAYVPMIGILLFISQLRFPSLATYGKVAFGSIASVYLLLSFVRMNDYSTEFNFLTQAIEHNPDSYFFRQKMAEHLLARNDAEGAAKQYSEAIRIQPSRAMFWNNRGNIYTKLGRKDEALRDFDSAIVRSNNDPAVVLNKCITLSKLNEFDASMTELKRLKQCCQEMIPPDIEKEIVMRWTMNSLVKIEELLRAQPNNAILYANRARLNYDVGLRDAALLDKQKALSLAPENEQLKRYLEMIK